MVPKVGAKTLSCAHVHHGVDTEPNIATGLGKAGVIGLVREVKWVIPREHNRADYWADAPHVWPLLGLGEWGHQ
jgi:hypothetical protein